MGDKGIIKENVNAEVTEATEVMGAVETETVESNQFLFQGKRGLYFKSEAGKIYFPDKSFTDVEAGCVTNVKITKDKGKYAFFTGEMVRDKEKMSLKDVFKHVEGLSFGSEKYFNPVKTPSTKRGKFAGSDVVFTRDNGGAVSNWTVWVEGKVFCQIKATESCFGMDHSLYEGMENITDLGYVACMFGCGRYTINDWEDQVLGILRRICLGMHVDGDGTSFFEGLEFGAEDIECVICGSDDLISNDVVLFTRKDIEGCVYAGSLAKRSMAKVLKMSMDDLLYQLNVVYRPVDIKELWEFAKERHLAISPVAANSHSQTLKHQVRLGKTVGASVELLNPVVCGSNLVKDESLQKDLESQAQNYISWFKKVCKGMSKETIAQIAENKRAEKETFGYYIK